MITRFVGKSCENLNRVKYEYGDGVAKGRKYLTSNHLA